MHMYKEKGYGEIRILKICSISRKKKIERANLLFRSDNQFILFEINLIGKSSNDYEDCYSSFFWKKRENNDGFNC